MAKKFAKLETINPSGPITDIDDKFLETLRLSLLLALHERNFLNDYQLQQAEAYLKRKYG